MKVGDWVMIVPHKPMAATCRALVGQSATILSGPHYPPSHPTPGATWQLDLIPSNGAPGFSWWYKHLMVIDPPEEVKDEETADDDKKKSEAPHQGAERNRSLQPEKAQGIY